MAQQKRYKVSFEIGSYMTPGKLKVCLGHTLDLKMTEYETIKIEEITPDVAPKV